MYWEHHYWGMHGYWWIFWAVLITVLVLRPWPSNRFAADDSALDELRRRYAAGEIDDEQYQHRFKVLTSKGKASRKNREERHKGPDKGSAQAHAK